MEVSGCPILLVGYIPKVLFVQNFDMSISIATDSRGKTETYWGFDHIGQVTDHLGLGKPKTGTKNEGGWRATL